MNIDKNGFVVEAPDKNGNVTVQAGIIKTKTKVKNLKLIENSPSFTDKSVIDLAVLADDGID